MQPVVVAKPYEFVPPHTGNFWPALLRRLTLRRFLSRDGVESVDCRGVDRLRASIAAGHGIVLAPNHCRPIDPFVVAALGREAGCHVFIMASWHLFMQGRLQRFLLPRAGVFSLYREGLDRESLKCAVEILTEARRPLVVFPEGVISRHNDRLNPMMDGVALMARAAAKARATTGRGKVVVHPVAIRYRFDGDAEAAVAPILDDLERRLTWVPDPGAPTATRISRIAGALVAPSVFGVLQAWNQTEGRVLAGQVFGEVLLRLTWLSYAMGVIMFVTLTLHRLLGARPPKYGVRVGIMGVMLVMMLATGFYIIPRVNSIQAQVKGPVSALVVRIVGSLKYLAKLARARTLFLNSAGA